MHSPRFQILCLLILTVVTCSCTPGSKTAEQKADSLTADSAKKTVSGNALIAVDTAQILDDSNDPAELKKLFTPVQIKVIKLAKHEFENAHMARDLARFYLITLDTVAKIVNTQIGVKTPTESSGDNTPAATWAWFPNYFPVLSSDVTCSECEYEALVELEPFITKAASTPEPEDDLFFDLAKTVYGDRYSPQGLIINNGDWYRLVSCDFCAASTLGSGMRVAVLQKLEKASSARPLFGDRMDKFFDATLAVNDDHFLFDKGKVMDELNQMMKSSLLTNVQRDTLQQRIGKINLQTNFGCEKADCQWPDY